MLVFRDLRKERDFTRPDFGLKQRLVALIGQGFKGFRCGGGGEKLLAERIWDHLIGIAMLDQQGSVDLCDMVDGPVLIFHQPTHRQPWVNSRSDIGG